jgi:hypothetical protein
VTYPEPPSDVPPPKPAPEPAKYPPGVASVPSPPVDPYGPAVDPYDPYGYGSPPPGYPIDPTYGAAAQPPPKRRRTGLIVGIIVTVLVLCVGGSLAGAVALMNAFDGGSNPPPGTSAPPATTRPRATPTPTRPPDYTGDLRRLLVPRPPGAEPWSDFPSDDGTLNARQASDLFQDEAAMRAELRDQRFRRGAANHWNQGGLDVLIILFQFETADGARDFVSSTEDSGVDDHTAEGDFGDIPGSLTYVARSANENGQRSTIFLSSRGNIASYVVVWHPGSVDLQGATALAVRQHERLP